MKKRMFQIIDEMNVADGENGTANAGVSPHFVRGNLTKQGGEITMGVPSDIFHDILSGKVKPILLTLNMEEYRNIEKSVEE